MESKITENVVCPQEVSLLKSYCIDAMQSTQK